MHPSIVASAIAADSLGYPGAAAMIREQKLSPREIARLFACSASRDRGHVVAVVLVAGATARFNAYRDAWDSGCLERELAEQALGTIDDAVFASLCKAASAIVGRHWSEIAGKVPDGQKCRSVTMPRRAEYSA
jgi:hypothetical protein